MSGDGCGGDGGGHCFDASAVGGDGCLPAGLGAFDPDPARKLGINGAPIIEKSHEFVVQKKPKHHVSSQ